MTAQNHTVEKWEAIMKNGCYRIFKKGHEGMPSIASVNENHTEDKAHALLLASAPELLTACEYALKCLSDPNEEDVEKLENLLESAIGKARGEG